MYLPVADRIRLAYSQVELWFGLLLVLVGAGTSTQADWDTLYFWFGPVATVPGRIATVYSTTFEVNDRAVRGFTYRYPAAGLEWAGNSFSSDSTMLPGQPAEVEYCLAHPAVSRLKGADSMAMGTTGLVVSLLLGGAGLSVSWGSIRHVRRLLAIADDAAIVQAVYEHTTTETDSDDGKHYTWHYVFEAGPQRYTLRVDAASAVPSQGRATVVFQKTNPANAVLAAALPSFVQKKLVPPRHE